MTSTPTTLYPVNNDFGRMGYSYGTAGGYLYVFGGGKRNGPNTTILNSAISAELCGPTSTGGQICSGLLPDTSNWNADPVSLSHPRYLSGITKESSLFFILGGTSDTEAATNTVDWIYY